MKTGEPECERKCEMLNSYLSIFPRDSVSRTQWPRAIQGSANGLYLFGLASRMPSTGLDQLSVALNRLM